MRNYIAPVISVKMADNDNEIYNSESDDSEFSGFGLSDIESDIDIASDSESSDTFDSEDDEPLARLTEWSNNFSNITINPFNAPSGPNLPPEFDAETASAIDYFNLLFKPALYSEIARHTNNYARWTMEQTNKDDPRWSETTDQEIKAFVGMNIIMGINHVPEVRMYWSTDCFIGNQGISKVMTANRYSKLSQYFHVSDRASEPAKGSEMYDRLYKVRPIVESVSDTFLTHYNVGREVSVDEAMVRFAGKLGMLQFMPNKPVKRGIKIWMACDANTAYLSRFDVYLGKGSNQETEHGLGFNVVTKLTDNLHETNRHIYFDNFFTGVPLMNYLLEKDLYACGTVRINKKGVPSEVKKPKSVKQRGQMKILQKGRSNLTASVWMDKKHVHHLSTLSDPTDIKDCTRRIGPDIVPMKQPASVASYNMYMGGVDRHDQLRMKYDVGRNSKKWWRYLFWFFVNCAITNAYIMYKEVSRRTTKKKKFSHLDFRMEVAKDLIAGFSNRKRRASVLLEQTTVQNKENMQAHVSVRMPNAKGGRCIYHRKYVGKRKDSVYGCAQCNVYLCRDVCHGLFHSLGKEDIIR